MGIVWNLLSTTCSNVDTNVHCTKSPVVDVAYPHVKKDAPLSPDSSEVQYPAGTLTSASPGVEFMFGLWYG
jgi:hypothetical protein